MELRDEIKKTIAYGKKFGANIDQTQLLKRIISSKEYSKEQIKAVAQELGVKEKNNKNYLAQNKIIKAKKIAKLLAINKNILFIGITGSVSYENPNKNDDIDLMIITKENKLWTTRLWLKLWVFMHHIPHRKYNRKENGDEFCFNLWISESELLIPKEKQNFRNGLDLINTIKLLNRKKTWEKFVWQNDWVKKKLATPYLFLIKKNNYIPKNDVLETRKLSVWETMTFLVQILVIKSKRKNDLVNLNQAFFHEWVKKK